MIEPLDKEHVRRIAKRVTGHAEQIGDLDRYRDDPVSFAHDVLGVQLWSHQRRALEAIAKHRRVAWRSCHGVGKTVVTATAASWFVTQPDSLCIITAPSHRQVRAVDWRTLSQLIRRAKQPLGGELYDSPEHGWQFSDGRGVFGFSAGDAEKFAGFHARRLLVIVDEASGVEGEIYEALKGALTGDSRLLLVGNPTKTSGEFYEAFSRKAQLYHLLHTGARDVPNISGAEPAIPGLIDQAWLDEMALDYGEESAAFSVRALGNFPLQGDDCIISIALVEEAKERWHALAKRPAAELGPLCVGCDPARFGGDETTIVVRRGPVAYTPIALRGASVVEVAKRVAAVVSDHAMSGERAIVRVDTVGVGGGVADILRSNYRLTMQVVDVNAGESPMDSRYARTRDELWFSMRDWLRAGGALPPCPKTEGDLLAPTYSFTPAQKIQVEPKDETKKRLKRSPDRADALALAVYDQRRTFTPMRGVFKVQGSF